MMGEGLVIDLHIIVLLYVVHEMFGDSGKGRFHGSGQNVWTIQIFEAVLHLRDSGITVFWEREATKYGRGGLQRGRDEDDIPINTHMDFPALFYKEYYEAGLDVDTLDLYFSNEPALVVDDPRDTNIVVAIVSKLHLRSIWSRNW
ncbi:hypothetical protein SUGI_0154330 [Cryptomeria japonica]|nr:hypothetical protein SUGI_0154330 [Cryptomeria japonica]